LLARRGDVRQPFDAPRRPIGFELLLPPFDFGAGAEEMVEVVGGLYLEVC
jgi:hypothetical protein